jgi:hypothetical protein
MRRAAVVAILASLSLAQPAFADPLGINWGAVLKAVGGALDSWRLSPFTNKTPTPLPTRTRTPVPAATVTRTPSNTRTATRTITPSVTRTPTLTATPSRTITATRQPTDTRTPTLTRTPTRTYTPRPTATAVPTTSANGQIAFDLAPGAPPAQKLASAYIVLPYIVSTATQNTRIELMNMSAQDVQLQCFYVRQSDCVEVGFFLRLTANQPLSWLAFDGTSNPISFSSVPPFDGVGELKCAVAADRPELSAHNVLQGRALVYERTTGETVGYDAIGFQRLSPGTYDGTISLDGFTYEECPDRLHFVVLSRQSGGPVSELITVTCAEDLLTQTPTQTTVQLAIVNEFEQVFSSSYKFSCITSQPFSKLSTINKSTLGTDTAHIVVRGVSTPLIGMVIDRFNGQNNTLHTTANEPFLEGGRDSTVILP